MKLGRMFTFIAPGVILKIAPSRMKTNPKYKKYMHVWERMRDIYVPRCNELRTMALRDAGPSSVA
jgi:hypothetical protein